VVVVAVVQHCTLRAGNTVGVVRSEPDIVEAGFDLGYGGALD
jgi:hypothetical protein